MPALAPNEITNRQICDALSPYAVSPTDGQIAHIRAYLELLLKWNRAISLTSIQDPSEIVGRHFGESMFAAKLLPVENCRLADVGTGAGFPGLALKISCPSLHLSLIESNKKKCAFLAEVVRTLEFSGVEIHPERFEQIRPEIVRANIIVSRAVGEFKQLLGWSAGALAQRGHIMIWVGAEDAARIAGNSNWIWQPAVHIPDSQRRFILIGRPLSAATPHQ
jgi:16S rRNA (guanine527-N7)-methyltransferase